MWQSGHTKHNRMDRRTPTREGTGEGWGGRCLSLAVSRGAGGLAPARRYGVGDQAVVGAGPG